MVICKNEKCANFKILAAAAFFGIFAYYGLFG